MYILKYENFNESKGISDSSEKITNTIWDYLEPYILKVNNTKKSFTFNEIDFKVDISIEMNIKNGLENKCNAISILNFSPYKIIFDIEYTSLDEPFTYYIKSVILHEVLHIFQYYNLKLYNKFRPESFSIGSIIPQIRGGVKTKYINYILDVLYYSLSHELSAQLHQYYMYLSDGIEYKKIFEIKNLLSNFKIKELDKYEEDELNYIKKHILGSISFLTTNKNYKKDISKSLWNKDNKDFLIDLSKLINKKVKWIEKKMILINSKLGLDYNETFTFYGELKDYKYMSSFIFIKENLNDCPKIYNI